MRTKREKETERGGGKAKELEEEEEEENKQSGQSADALLDICLRAGYRCVSTDRSYGENPFGQGV